MSVKQLLGTWPVWVMGWPSVVLSLACALAGLVLRKVSLMAAGVFVAMPFCCYLFLNPGKWRFIAPTIVITYWGAAYALAKGRRGLALLLTAPFLLVIGWLAMRVAGS